MVTIELESDEKEVYSSEVVLYVLCFWVESCIEEVGTCSSLNEWTSLLQSPTSNLNDPERS